MDPEHYRFGWHKNYEKYLVRYLLHFISSAAQRFVIDSSFFKGPLFAAFMAQYKTVLWKQDFLVRKFEI